MSASRIAYSTIVAPLTLRNSRCIEVSIIHRLSRKARCGCEGPSPRLPGVPKGLALVRRTYVRMKQCSKCGLTLPISEFRIRSRANRTYHSHCKRCFRSYSNAYYHSHVSQYSAHRRRNARKKRLENRRRMLDILARSQCIDCGEKDPLVLEFDHVRGEKKGNVCDLIGSLISWKRIEEEIAKCVVRCANCHRRKTARDYKWFRSDFGA